MNWIRASFLIPLFPLLAFLIIVFVTRYAKRTSAKVAIGFNVLSFLLCAVILFKQGSSSSEFSLSWIDLPGIAGFLPFHLEMGMLLDPLSILVASMVTFVSTLIFIYSTGYMADDPAFSLFFSYMSLFVSAMLTLVFSNNFLLTFVAWELVGLCSYLLIGFWFKKLSAARAAVKAFVVTRTGDIGFLIGIIMIYHLTGTLNFSSLSAMDFHKILTGWLIWGVPLLIFCGAVGKSAQFPLHVWLPDAMEGPTPVSALIHAATMVAAGVYLVARSYFLFVQSPIALLVVACIGVFTAFLAATLALVQWDSKRVLAYSTVSQLGYMMLALGAGPLGFVAAIFHLLTHAFFKALLFLGAGSVAHPFHQKENPFDMHHYGGLAKKMPWTFLSFFLATLAITGCPFFSGFFSKDEILGAAFHSRIVSHSVLGWLGILVAYLTSTYMFRMFFLIFYGEKNNDAHAHESPSVMTIPLLILAFFAVFAGALGIPEHSWIADFFVSYKILYHIPETKRIDWFSMQLGTVVFLLGYATAWFLYAKQMRLAKVMENSIVKLVHSFLVQKWYLDDFWNGILQFLGYGFSTFFSWFDAHVVDGVVHGIGGLVGWIGQKLRFTQTGFVQQYALVIFCSVLLALIWLSFTGGHGWMP